LVAVALEIEAELPGAESEATPEELTAIDEGFARESAIEHEVKAVFALVWRT